MGNGMGRSIATKYFTKMLKLEKRIRGKVKLTVKKTTIYCTP